MALLLNSITTHGLSTSRLPVVEKKNPCLAKPQRYVGRLVPIISCCAVESSIYTLGLKGRVECLSPKTLTLVLVIGLAFASEILLADEMRAEP